MALGLMFSFGLKVSSAEPAPSTASAPDCQTCHANIRLSATAVNLATAPHEKLTCNDCHVGIESLPHAQRPSPVDCSSCHARQSEEWHQTSHAVRPGGPTCATCHGSHELRMLKTEKSSEAKLKIADLCGRCHSEAYKKFENSVHAGALKRGSVAAATCTNCHGEHFIQGAQSTGSRVSPAAVAATCGSCHNNLKLVTAFGLPANRLSTFKASFHSVALDLGNSKAANCASCHGAHDILASKDPASRTHPTNLPKTCGGCHLEAKAGFAKVKIHTEVSPTGARGAWFVRVFYIFFITVLISGFVLYILAELFGALRKRKNNSRGAASRGRGEP